MAGSRHETIEESAGEACSLSSEQSAGASAVKALPVPPGAGQMTIEASRLHTEYQQVSLSRISFLQTIMLNVCNHPAQPEYCSCNSHNKNKANAKTHYGKDHAAFS